MAFMIKRRTALAGAAALAAVPAAAQDKKVIVGTWGGDYSKLLSKNIDTPLMAPKKYEVVHDIGGDSERRAKMRAGSAKRRPSNSLLTRKSRYSVNPAAARTTTRNANRRNRQNLPRRATGAFYLAPPPSLNAISP